MLQCCKTIVFFKELKLHLRTLMATWHVFFLLILLSVHHHNTSITLIPVQSDLSSTSLPLFPLCSRHFPLQGYVE